MPVRLDYTNMMADVIGDRYGISDAELQGLEEGSLQLHEDLMARRSAGELPFYDLPFQSGLTEQTLQLADTLAGRFSDLVVLGIGGSALGTLALFRALLPLHYNLLAPAERNGRPRLFVLDNVDPVGIAETLDLLDPQSTVFCVISKSGTTVETSCQFVLAQQWLSGSVGNRWREHFVLITDPEKGSLRQLVERDGFSSLPIPDGVGGRFSVFTPVGLLPLAAVGVDIRGLLAGAAAMSERTTRPGLFTNPAYLNAALQYLAYQKGLNISVMMPYSDQLRDVADWYRQLWAESLGKKFALDGSLVNVGPTPVKALGTTDQHSQVQLYMEGPYDKTVTFLTVDDFGRDMVMSALPGAPELDYLEGHSLAELISAEQQATAVALTKNGRSNCTLSLTDVTAPSLGELLFLLEVQTVFAGGLFKIDPLDQPGVEEGKQLTYALMGRAGYASQLEEFKRWSGGVNRRIL